MFKNGWYRWNALNVKKAGTVKYRLYTQSQISEYRKSRPPNNCHFHAVLSAKGEIETQIVPWTGFSYVYSKHRKNLFFVQNDASLLERYLSLNNSPARHTWNIISVPHGSLERQCSNSASNLINLTHLPKWLRKSAKSSLYKLKHCQRHYGPRCWLLWPVILGLVGLVQYAWYAKLDLVW